MNLTNPKPINTLLTVAVGIILLAAVSAVVGILYESPEHKEEDATRWLLGLKRTESLSDGHIIKDAVVSSIQAEVGEPVEVDWAGIEWAKVSLMVRAHATTTDGKRYLVQLLYEPTLDQEVKVVRREVVDVSDKTTSKGL